MGITNLFRCRVTGADASEVALDWDGLRLVAGPQPVAVGGNVTAYIRPEDVEILYPDRPVMNAVRHNRVAGRITASALHPGARHLWIALPNGHEIEVQHPTYTYAPLNLEPGQPVRLALRKEALVLLK
jgi:molybdate transport system ATP-binding protein